MPADSQTPISIKIRIFQDGIAAFGPGKAALLEAIGESHSISAAGRSMGLSYTKTRKLVDELNHSFQAPVVESSKGGAQHGGAQVTATGWRVLAVFRAMEAQAQEVVQEGLMTILSEMGPVPPGGGLR